MGRAQCRLEPLSRRGQMAFVAEVPSSPLSHERMQVNPLSQTELLVLGIDTSSPWGSLGIVEEDSLVASLTLGAPAGHGGGLAARIDWLLREAGTEPRALHAIGVVNGPGSFTALRVGVATAQGLGLALGVPVVPIGTLEALVGGLPVHQGRVLALVPARKGEVFAQVFEGGPLGGWLSRGVAGCVRLEELAGEEFAADLVTGPAVDLYPKELSAILGAGVCLGSPLVRYPRGEVVARLAQARLALGAESFPADQVEIRYLQSHGALTVKERDRGNRHVAVRES